MPSRLDPWAAVIIGFGSALALAAVVGVLREPEEALPEVPWPLPPAPRVTIDDTLTPDEEGCAGVRSIVWHPLSGVEYTGRLRILLPPLLGGAIVLYVGDVVRLDVEVDTVDGSPLGVTQEQVQAGPGVQVPPDYWLDDQAPSRAPQELTRVTIEARGDRAVTLRVSLGRRAPRVLARLIGYEPHVKVPVCAEPVRPGERYFATGWYEEERTAAGPVRWMREHGAVLVRSPHGGEARVRIRAAPAPDGGADGPTKLTLRVNDVIELPAVAMRDGLAEYEWSVPDAAWVPGTNELFFSVSRVERRGTRTLGLRLASLHAE